MHYVHRLIRKVRRWRSAPPAPPATDAELWYVLSQGPGGGFAAPAAHVSRSAAFPASEVRPGDVIWLFAGMEWGRRRLPEGLDAKIVVARVEREAGRARFVAGPGSRWYPQADWSGLLADPVMAYETASGGRRRFADHAHVGQALRNLRRLTPEAAARIEAELARRGDLSDYDFISYRHRDGLPRAVEAVYRRLAAGRAVWWDRWCLPRRLVERREFVPPAALEQLIFARIEGAARVIGVETPLYDAPGAFSVRERAAAGGRYVRLEALEAPEASAGG